MANAKRKLTDLAIAKLKPAAPGKRYIVWDRLDHLGVRVTDRAAKSFIVVKRLPKGKPIVHVLGRYPILTLAQARDDAKVAIELLASGRTPREAAAAAARAQALIDADTFDIALERFIAHEKAKRLRRWRATEAVLRREFMGQVAKRRRVAVEQADGSRVAEWATTWLDGPDPMWRGRAMSSIARADIRARLDAIKLRNRHAARHALTAVRALSNWCEDNESFGIVVSPAARIKDRHVGLTGKDLHRTRVLGNDELRSVWQAAEAAGYPFGSLVQLLMLTGQRLNDIARADWSEIDRDAAMLRIPPERFKSGVAQEVPLTPKALAIIEALPTFSGPFLFTSTSGERPMGAFAPPKQRLLEAIGAQRLRDGLRPMAPWVLHDLRRTVRTRLTSDCDIDSYVAERVIGHTLQGLHKIYDQGSHRKQKRAALLAWESHLLAIVDPPLPAGGNVISLKQRA